ncbi:adenylate/guanylate cyclase domain-containing protein [Spirulina subsalsa FACHB-351]|uniref:Adenylate/guanylate cyclase domain-containing protein n=1 Tax=Spirulina subsalsa FACHB-351 TaxID=234711 RepID=A0ABT3L5Y1_9CYAN|nr:adenylate/guanylate cyclase domain-containing protein [Spirulina subsalsa]MCW6036918.1 adenylate/guanylate cyclase domain-containing protein [Spirulina subsalsa FACHB-351]
MSSPFPTPKRPFRWTHLLQSPRLRWSLIVLWAVGAGLLTAGDDRVTQSLERNTQSLLFQARLFLDPPDVPEEIVIVTLDDASLSAAQKFEGDPQRAEITELLQSYPWPRRTYGLVVERLLEAGAKTVTIDLLFDLPSGYGEEDDQAFQAVLERYVGKVTLGAAYLETMSEEGSEVQLFEPFAVLNSPNLSLGSVNFLTEANERVYRLGAVYQEQIASFLNLPIIPSLAQASLESAGMVIPPARGEGIFYWGLPHRTFPHVSFWRILDPEEWPRLEEAGVFRDKIVLIGTTSATFTDFQRTPVSERMPGVEVHGHAIATLLENKAMATLLPHFGLKGFIVTLAVLSLGLAVDRFVQRPGRQLLWGLGFMVLWLGGSYILFSYGQWILPTAIPAIALFLSSFSSFFLAAMSNQLEKLRLRNTLERYVAEPVVKEILKHPDSFYTMLPGHKLNVAVLFSDVRGFTTLSFQLPPEELIAQLNTYFHTMVEAIVQNNGTLDKFIGDAVMAEFGFPLSHGPEEDALNAIRAALTMRQDLALLRQYWQAENRQPLFNGIGISYGEVIAGDIGSWRRREYAVMGDTVNIASRVEGLTKELGTDILITESLYELVKDKVEVTDLGEHQLKGRSLPVRLYSLVGLSVKDGN